MEDGLAHQVDMPNCPNPEDLEDDNQRWEKIRQQLDPNSKQRSSKNRPSLRPIQMRSVEPIDYVNPQPRKPEQLIWIRAAGDLPKDTCISLHHAILAYASDFSLMSTSLMPHGISIMNPKLQPASLDHCIWFHDSFEADQWLLYQMESTRSSRARGLSRGSFFSRDGRLVASTIQEGLMRLHED
jgi:acyl-CoA thioesterase-2